MRWGRLIITLAGIGLLLALLSYGFHRDPRYIPSPLLGSPAPPFTLTLFDGRQISLGDFEGETVFISFWASWCLPCREEARDLEAAWRSYRDNGGDDVVFLGINIQDERKAALAFIEEFGITYANGEDADGHIAVDYGVWGIPEAFFVSPQGIVTYKHIGAVPVPVLRAKLREAAAGRVSQESGKGSYQTIK